jgi:fluoride exporter
MIPLGIAIAGGVGAVCRFIADSLIRTVLGRRFPWGTLIINVVGSFILGILTGMAYDRQLSINTELVLGMGFCGGFTTFSTASFEAARLLEEERYMAALLQVLGNLGVSLAAAALGFWLVH